MSSSVFVWWICVALFYYVHVEAQNQCSFQGGPNNQYTLNLTAIQDWTIELENVDYSYYYTPCGNREICVQGNQQTASNVVQYRQSDDQCTYYLSIDHHEQPRYSLGLGAWIFGYQDGQLCQQTNSPRTTQIYYDCDPDLKGAAWFYAAEESSSCHYSLQIRSPLACVAENELNAQCQWKHTNAQNTTYSLDLSSLKGTTIYAAQNNETNHYVHYFSPCSNNLQCYQAQEETQSVMAMIENSRTATCDTYLAVWEDGRVNPVYHAAAKYWSFQYINGRKCNDGSISDEIIRFYCDEMADTPKVINATYDNQCRYQLNIASKLACHSDKVIT